MEYLHSIQPHPVIHGDLKVQNILVGDGLVTKVCVIVYFVHICVCHCYSIAWDELLGYKITSVCLSAVTPASAIFTQFDEIFHR